MKEILTVQDVAKMLNCSDENVRRLAKSKRLRSVSISPAGKRENLRFKPEWINDFMESESEAAPAKPSKSQLTLIRSTHMQLGAK